MTAPSPRDREIATPTPELLPCPFCGGPAEYDSQRWTPLPKPLGMTGHAIYCAGPCDVIMGLFQTKEEAFEAWNQRDPVALAAARAEGMEWRPISECAFGQQIVGTASAPEGWHDPVVGWWTEEGDDWPTHWTPTHFLLVPEPPQEPGE